MTNEPTRARSMRATLILTAIAIVTLLAAGCHKPVDPVVGKWTLTKPMQGGSVVMTYDFKADGSVTTSLQLGAVGSISAQGKYVHKNGSLTVTYATETMSRGGAPATTTPSKWPPQTMKVDVTDKTMVIHGGNSQELTLNRVT